MKVPVQILFVFRWCQIGHAVVHIYVSVFGMLGHRKPKYHRYVIFCYLVVLTIYLWLNRGLPPTIVLPWPTSRIHLKTTLFIICQDPLAEEADLLLSHAKGGVDCYILSIPCLWWFQLSLQWQLKCKPPTIFWLSFFCWSVIPSSSSLGTHLGTSRRDVKTPFVLWNAP